MAAFSLRAAALLVLVAALGCQNGPTFGGFGGTAQPARQQRETAQVFDPYPQPEYGPEVLGGRPRDFDRPPVEPTRARAFSSEMRGLPTPADQQLP